jgi:Kef-type K+ transport system membrane component KefB
MIQWLNDPMTQFLLVFVSPEARLPLAVLLVFGFAKLWAEIAQRFRQPAIVGEILAGILIGPSLLNWVAPNALLDALAQLGVMFLLFRVGLETRSSDLLKVGGTATLVAVLGVIAPFVAGWGILRAWGYGGIEAVFIGAAMVATSVGITAQVLASKGLLDRRASRIILAAAVIDDVLGLLVLAAVSGLASGRVNVAELAISGVLALGFTLLVARWGTPAMQHVLPRAQHHLRIAEAEFVLAMILLFGLSLLAVYAGVAAIIGAFLAGMAMAESAGPRVHQLTSGVAELLVPFFLVGIGLHFDVGAFGNARTLLLAVVIIVAAVVSKLAGCGLGAIRLGRTEALRVGVGMIPRGEVGMVVARIGLGLGAISAAVYGVAVAMAVLTTVIAPPLLYAAFRNVTNEE